MSIPKYFQEIEIFPSLIDSEEVNPDTLEPSDLYDIMSAQLRLVATGRLTRQECILAKGEVLAAALILRDGWTRVD